MLLSVKRSTLLIIDLQERLAPAVHDLKRVLANVKILLAAARTLEVPVLASEQYPKGLGPTLPEIAALLATGGAPQPVIEKTHFSCLAEPGFAEFLAPAPRDQIVIAGIEAHVCVLQTALDFKAMDRDVFVVADACSSRSQANADLAFERMRRNDIDVVSTEMVVFEWLHQAGSPAFKSLSALVR
ncbi:MAG: hydrolase [Rhodospirillaceae bacterium]